jgi:hypothetical protein
MMTVYYRGPDVLITHEVFHVMSPQPQTFSIGELRGVCVVEGGRRPWIAVPAWFGSALVAVLAVALPVALVSPHVFVIVLVLAATSVVSVACLRDSSPYELRALHRGRQVTLFRCRNVQTFGQVRRALQRSIEGYGGEW